MLKYLIASLIVITITSITIPTGAADTPKLYPLPPNIAEVRARYPNAEGAEAMLRRNGFVVLGDISRPALDQAYTAHGRDPHIFVTTDALLALWYGLHRHILTDAEQNALAPSLASVVPALTDAGQTLAAQTDDEASHAALRRAMLLLAVAKLLLDDNAAVPPELRTEAHTLAAKVLAHQEREAYPGEDYTQYAVRGHYADSPALSRYFRASLWLSRQFQPVTPVPGTDPDAPLRTAIALADIVRAAPDARAALDSLNQVRQALTGRPNAVSVEQFLAALNQNLGPRWTLDQALQPAALIALRRKLEQTGYPHVLVQTRSVWPDTPFPKQIIALLPDYALPDSALFQDTVNPKVPQRSLPTGLEVAVALGFEAARAPLKTSDPQSDAVLAALAAHTPLVSSNDTGIYDGWMRTLATLHEVPPHAPLFMTGDAWQFEKINTALASWAQARHSYVLYGTQSYAQLMGIEPALPGLVEANPAFFQSLAALARETRETLVSAKALSAPDATHIQALEAQCQAFANDAEAELAGTLSPERSNAISDFGNWLEQFQLQTGPLVADVATGMNGEVRHVATGGFHPLIVIPDPKTGTAYVGWTMSYYEFSRPAGDRLTDAHWQQILDAPLLHPDRPSWAGEFVYQDRGTAWQSRAPLRQAEALFLAHREDEALTLLRQTMAASSETTLATEAQCRLGQYYEGKKDSPRAAAEYLKCRRLPGGDAADTARIQSLWLIEQQSRDERQASSPEVQAIGEARTLLIELKHPDLSAAERAKAERQLTTALVRAYGTISGWTTKDPDLLLQAISVCRTPELRELLRYLRLMVRPNDESNTPASRRLPDLLAFANAAHSPALKAAAFCAAAQVGYLAEEPDQLVTTLTPYLSFKDFQADPAYLFLTHAAGDEDLDSDINPKWIVDFAAMSVREQIIQKAYQEGRFEDMTRYDAALPHQTDMSDRSDACMETYRRYPDFDRQPLRLYIRANTLRQTAPESAVALYWEICDKYPASTLALPGLRDAETLLRQLGQTEQADALRAKIIQTYGNTPMSLFYQAQEAAEQGDIGAAMNLLDKIHSPSLEERVSGDQDQASEEFNYQVMTLRMQIVQTQRFRQVLRPIVTAAGHPELANLTPLETDNGFLAVADRIADTLPPAQAASVYLALIPLRELEFSKVPLSLHALAHDPENSHAAELWENLTSDRAFGGGAYLEPASPAETDLAVGLLNRGPSYAYASQALILFGRMVAGGGGSGVQNWRGAVENAKFIAGRNTGTRAGEAALCVAARTLLENGRPEEAASLISDTKWNLTPNDPIRADVDLLRRRATREIWAKHQPDWSPLWQTQVGPKGGVVIDSYSPDSTIGVVGGTLVVLWAGKSIQDDDRGWQGLAGLDPATGKIKWRTAVGTLRDVSGAAGRVFAVTQDGKMTALDAAKGHILYQQMLAVESRIAQLGWVLATDKNVITVTGRAVTGLDPATGKTLWKQPWNLSGIRGSVDKPSLIGETLYCATTDGHLRAVNTETGVVLWDHSTPADDPMSRRIGTGQPLAAGTRYLLTQGDTFQAWNAKDGTSLLAMRQVEARVWLDGLLANNKYLVKWNQNMTGDVSRLPDLAPLPVRLAPKELHDDGFIRGNILYVNGQDRTTNLTVFQAIDVATGAVLGWWPMPHSFSSWVCADDKYVYLASADGTVRAFPLFHDPPDSP